jgi:RNA polymerase sigma-70 factor (ECF subfamily)
MLGAIAELIAFARPDAGTGAGRAPLYATLAPRNARVADAETDLDLMVRVGSGDAQAYRVLSERHLTSILRYAARVLGDTTEAEDVAQETFLRLWQEARRFEVRQAKPSTWLYRIAHNLCIDRLRRRREVGSDALDRRSGGDRPSGLYDRKELASAVQAALSALPERQRAAVVLVHYEGMDNIEAAEVLGCGVEAVESLLARGRRALREQLTKLYAQFKGEPA